MKQTKLLCDRDSQNIVSFALNGLKKMRQGISHK